MFTAKNPQSSASANRPWTMVLTTVYVSTLLTSPVVIAQGSRSKDKESPNTQQLEIRLTKAEEGLLKEYMDVAKEFLKKDDKEEALKVLKRVQHINSKLEGLQQEMDRINEELMMANDVTLEMDVSKFWGSAICDVTEGKAFRLTAAGEYKMSYAVSIPVTGLPTENPAQDHVTAGPFGALIGVVVTDGKPGEPFVVNGGLEQTPKKSGQLYLRVNVPAAAKCTGTIKLQLSGAISAVAKKR